MLKLKINKKIGSMNLLIQEDILNQKILQDFFTTRRQYILQERKKPLISYV